ncbi:hypothetical protein RND81_09G179200 [Saponaria officinalis]|uniref:Uncharacterized protein n=1 Tax=Saponaria officinalis TaxID=3572 RepID=A0AAW1IN97_SAPOF
MIVVAKLRIPNSALVLDPNASAAATPQTSRKTRTRMRICSEYKIPKLEAFSKSKIERGVKDPPLISHSQHQLADYCTLLEGDASYSCWQAYFELQHLQEEYSKEEVEKLIIEAGGVKSLIGCLHGVAAILKANKHSSDSTTRPHHLKSMVNKEEEHMHIPDGLPKTAHEIEDEQNSRMPDSAYTKLLRLSSTLPAWYSSAPNTSCQ